MPHRLRAYRLRGNMNKDKSINLGWLLSYARIAIAGGIGGVAVVNTYALAMASVPAPNAENYAMAIGAAALAGIAKALHAV